MTTTSGQGFTGCADGLKGRITDIKFEKTALIGELTAVRAVGKEELTNSEKACNEFILWALCGELQVPDSQFIRLFWFFEPEQRGDLAVPAICGMIATRVPALNISQTRALAKMISPMPIAIVQGECVFNFM
ncbi:hypothetical protein K438DRAFT_1967328 [Mycena galopus ATCC 62051]|nr:hypothetical protein K438DRAFT_1967328 [Mycena galopus ATCC 62051]